jgi:hypothetical protein
MPFCASNSERASHGETAEQKVPSPTHESSSVGPRPSSAAPVEQKHLDWIHVSSSAGPRPHYSGAAEDGRGPAEELSCVGDGTSVRTMPGGGFPIGNSESRIRVARSLKCPATWNSRRPSFLDCDVIEAFNRTTDLLCRVVLSLQALTAFINYRIADAPTASGNPAS